MVNRLLVDAGVAGGLMAGLIFVIVLDRSLPAPAVATPGQPHSLDPIPVTQTVKTPVLRLAVTRAYVQQNLAWDDMALLLSQLGEGYKFDLIAVQDLFDAKKFQEFDVLFLTCGADNNDNPSLIANLRNFVTEGGTLYASDWRYECVARAFPDLALPRLNKEGHGQDLDANVVDPGLRDLLGPTVRLKFDLDRWKPAAFGGDRVKVLLEGTYLMQKGNWQKAPLLVKFPFNKGTVIFTSFHNEKQNSEIETKLLKYLVFSAVTAKIENQVNQTLIKGGFSPRKSNLLSASPENAKVTYTYRSQKAGKIRFVLAFEERGARLRLTVTTPSGKRLEQEGSKTFEIEENSPGAADWHYTVTALATPFSEFPFTITVAESLDKK